MLSPRVGDAFNIEIQRNMPVQVTHAGRIVNPGTEQQERINLLLLEAQNKHRQVSITEITSSSQQARRGAA
jgi:hypothetical protein